MLWKWTLPYSRAAAELTRICFANSVNEVLIKSCYNSSTNRNQKVLISTLNKGINTTYPCCLQYQAKKHYSVSTHPPTVSKRLGLEGSNCSWMGQEGTGWGCSRLRRGCEVNLESKSWVTGRPTQSLSQGNVGCVKHQYVLVSFLRTLNGVSAWNGKENNLQWSVPTVCQWLSN